MAHYSINYIELADFISTRAGPSEWRSSRLTGLLTCRSYNCEKPTTHSAVHCFADQTQNPDLPGRTTLCSASDRTIPLSTSLPTEEWSRVSCEISPFRSQYRRLSPTCAK